MERLTKRDIDGCLIHTWSFNGINGSYDIWDEELLTQQIDRLAAYEDTGLEPEAVRRLMQDWTSLIMTLDELGGMPHLRELVQAEKDGRLVVPPCKVGDTVYGHSKAEVSEYKVAVISLATYNWYLRCQNHNSDFWVTDADIGRAIFLTREEAEAALVGNDSVQPTDDPEWKQRVMRTFLGGR